MVGNGSKSRIITKKPGSLTKVVFMSSSLARMSARPRRSKRSRRPKKPNWVSQYLFPMLVTRRLKMIKIIYYPFRNICTLKTHFCVYNLTKLNQVQIPTKVALLTLHEQPNLSRSSKAKKVKKVKKFRKVKEVKKVRKVKKLRKVKKFRKAKKVEKAKKVKKANCKT